MGWYRELRLKSTLKKNAKTICENEVPEENKGGNCFEVAARYVIDNKLFGNKNLKLVHGVVIGQGVIAGIKYDHAWVEDGDVVLDFSDNKSIKLPKFLYYALGKINAVSVYSPEIVRKKMLKYQHYGPWK